MNAEFKLNEIKVIGDASCVGGKHPDHPLDDFPLLAWLDKHNVHGDKIITEDGATTVEAISLDLAATPDYEVLATKHKTTVEHVRQAIDYAIAAEFLGKA